MTPLYSLVHSPWTPDSYPWFSRGAWNGGQGQLLVEPLYLPRNPGPRSDHGLGQPHRDEEELAKDPTPEEGWRGRQVSRVQWVQEAGLDVGARMRPQSHGWSKKGQKQHPQTCLLPPKCPSPSEPSHTGVGFLSQIGGWPSAPCPQCCLTQGEGRGCLVKRQNARP